MQQYNKLASDIGFGCEVSLTANTSATRSNEDLHKHFKLEVRFEQSTRDTAERPASEAEFAQENSIRRSSPDSS